MKHDESLLTYAAFQEAEARRLVRRSLPRGARWLVDWPGVLRILKWAGVWTPPVMRVTPWTLVERGGTLDASELFDVPPWLISDTHPRPRMARLRWRLRRVWPLKNPDRA